MWTENGFCRSRPRVRTALRCAGWPSCWWRDSRCARRMRSCTSKWSWWLTMAGSWSTPMTQPSLSLRRRWATNIPSLLYAGYKTFKLEGGKCFWLLLSRRIKASFIEHSELDLNKEMIHIIVLITLMREPHRDNNPIYVSLSIYLGHFVLDTLFSSAVGIFLNLAS